MSETGISSAGASTEASTEHAPRKKKRTSPVWEDFDLIEVGNLATGKCKHCSKEIPAISRNGTSNLKKHLTSYCSAYKLQADKLQQSTLTFGKSKKDGVIGSHIFKFNGEVSRDLLAEMIILHEYPFNMVSHIGFRKLLSSLQPSFRPKSRNTVRGDCIKRYKKEKKVLYKQLDNLKCRISLTSDLWTSNQNKDYISLTAHFIDDHWKLRKRILCFLTLKKSHTGENIANDLVKKLYEWNIDRKLGSITLDNCTTNDSVVRELLLKFKQKGVILAKGKMFQVRCTAHILNLVVQDGMKAIKNTIERVRASIKFITKSPQRQMRFEELCDQVASNSKKLVADVVTRWNSTYSMLESALAFKEGLSRYADMEPKFKRCVPSALDWKNAQIVCDCLKVFFAATKIVSGTKYTTINRYFDLSCGIKLQIDEWGKASEPFIKKLAVKMKKKFDKYWNITNVVFAIASILDPRVKMNSVEFYFDRIYGTESGGKVAQVRGALTSLFDEYVSLSASNQPWNAQTVDPLDGTSDFVSDINNPRDISVPPCNTFTSTIKSFEFFLEKSSQNVKVKTDLEMYLEEASHPLNIGKGLADDTFDILGWWKYSEPKYPIMGKLARDILAIPASSVASESTFSTGGRVINRYRSRMCPNIIEALICAQDWIRSPLQDEGLGGVELEIVLEVSDEVDTNDEGTTSNGEAQLSTTSVESHDEMDSESD